jgi:hypothetical protein
MTVLTIVNAPWPLNGGASLVPQQTTIDWGSEAGFRLPGFGIVLSRIEVRERLPVGRPDDVAAGHLVSAPGRRKAARRFCHPLMTNQLPGP